MNKVQQKLHNNRGSSILMALMFFLVCTIVGGVVLASAYSSAGRLTHIKKEQQAYLSVSAAAKLVRDELEAVRFETITVTTQKNGVVSQETKTELNGSPAMKEMVSTWMTKALENETYLFSEPSGFTITPDKTDMLSAVDAKFSMDDNYYIKVTFDGEKQPYKMMLTLTPVENTTESVETIDHFNGAEFLYSETITTTTTTVYWVDAAITKGGGSSV